MRYRMNKRNMRFRLMLQRPIWFIADNRHRFNWFQRVGILGVPVTGVVGVITGETHWFTLITISVLWAVIVVERTLTLIAREDAQVWMDLAIDEMKLDDEERMNDG